MIKKASKTTSFVLGVILILGANMNTVKAIERGVTQVSNPITTNSPNNTVDVNATIGSTFSVTIPKVIELSKTSTNLESTYEVTVKGDIAGDEIIRVVPDSSLTMSQSGKSDISGVISQTVTTATHDEITSVKAKVFSGSVRVDGATAGMWNGSFNFNIGLSKK